MKTYRYASVLTIAGSDSGGGAGIQADLKTFAALGCFGTSAITAITVQNTMGVTGIHRIPAAIVEGQIIAVMDDIQPSSIKVGMVHSTELAITISNALQKYPRVPVVFDPVMVATSGDKLIEDDTIAVIKKALFPLSQLITPNLDEAVVLAGKPITNVQEMKEAATTLLQTGCKAVLLKGGHLKGEQVYDVYADQQGKQAVFTSSYIVSHNVHGTGCTLSSAIAAYIALGASLEDAIVQAREYIIKAIEEGKDVQTGKGNGPLNHFFNPKKLQKYAME
jgi:hydroxymethylpyrimidine/phosphomethylpyrimidine kinase